MSLVENLVEKFCHIDDFCQGFMPKYQQQLVAAGQRHRVRAGKLCMSEVMTILIGFHQSHYRDFKAYYLEDVCEHLRAEFPGLVSYERFVELTPGALIPLCAYLRSLFGECTGISFIDSTPLAVCHNARISQHKVFAGLARRGKSSTGWFFGFKVHVVFNDRGELLDCLLTPGNTHDIKALPRLAKRLFGKLFGDKGYLSAAMFKTLFESFNVQLITKLKRNMKNKLMPMADKLLLRKRAIAETIIDQLKNISQIEHSRHRSPANFLVNLICGLIAYCLQPIKPSLNLSFLPALPFA
jgi:Transposase DDE domain